MGRALRRQCREQLPDVVDDRPGKIHDSRWDDNPTLSWGRKAAPGAAQVFGVPSTPKYGRARSRTLCA